MIEGKWLKKKEEKEKKAENYEDLEIRTQLVTYDEEKKWIEKEKKLHRFEKILDSEQNMCYTGNSKKDKEKT